MTLFPTLKKILGSEESLIVYSQELLEHKAVNRNATTNKKTERKLTLSKCKDADYLFFCAFADTDKNAKRTQQQNEKSEMMDRSHFLAIKNFIKDY